MLEKSSPRRKHIALNIAQFSHIGGRESNQDALGVAEKGDLTCFVVSDGVGGNEGGEIASNSVVRTIINKFQQDPTFSPHTLEYYTAFARAQLTWRQSEQPQLKTMSATVATVLIDCKNRLAIWGHMGDTRIYFFRSKKLYSVTKDHSLVQQLIDAGHYRPEQLRTHPQRSVLLAAIGVESDYGLEVTAVPTSVQVGDALLICTDGFWEWITESEMENAAESTHSAEEWLKAMQVIVRKNGGASTKPRDDSTALTIYIGSAQ